MLHSKPWVRLPDATKHYVICYTRNHGWDCQMLQNTTWYVTLKTTGRIVRCYKTLRDVLHSKPWVGMSDPTKYYMIRYTQNHGWDCQMLQNITWYVTLKTTGRTVRCFKTLRDVLHSKPRVRMSDPTKYYVMCYTQNHGWDCQMLPGFSTVFQLNLLYLLHLKKLVYISSKTTIGFLMIAGKIEVN